MRLCHQPEPRMKFVLSPETEVVLLRCPKTRGLLYGYLHCFVVNLYERDIMKHGLEHDLPRRASCNFLGRYG